MVLGLGREVRRVAPLNLVGGVQYPAQPQPLMLHQLVVDLLHLGLDELEGLGRGARGPVTSLARVPVGGDGADQLRRVHGAVAPPVGLEPDASTVAHREEPAPVLQHEVLLAGRDAHE